MENIAPAIEALGKVIGAAAVSNLGILALLVVIVGLLAYRFFHDSHVSVRVLIFLMMFAGAAAFGAAVILERNPVLAGARSEPKIKPAATTSATNPASSPVPVGVDLQCLERRLAELRDPQEITQDGGVGCSSAGISGRGNSKSATIVLRAPPEYQIVGPIRVSEVSNIDGSYGAVEYIRDGDRVVEGRVPVSCRSRSKPFGPGASMRVRLVARIEKPVTTEQRRNLVAECSK